MQVDDRSSYIDATSPRESESMVSATPNSQYGGGRRGFNFIRDNPASTTNASIANMENPMGMGGGGLGIMIPQTPRVDLP